MVGDGHGYLYAFDKRDGSPIWKTCIDPHGAGNDCSTHGILTWGILGNAAVDGNTVYQGTLSGKMVAVDIGTGNVVWLEDAGVNAPQGGRPIDSVWGGAIIINNGDDDGSDDGSDDGMVVFGTSPADQFGPLPDDTYARGGLVALNKHTGALVWRSFTFTDEEFADGASGAGTWHSSPTYSKELDMLYIGTGQARSATWTPRRLPALRAQGVDVEPEQQPRMAR